MTVYIKELKESFFTRGDTLPYRTRQMVMGYFMDEESCSRDSEAERDFYTNSDQRTTLFSKGRTIYMNTTIDDRNHYTKMTYSWSPISLLEANYDDDDDEFESEFSKGDMLNLKKYIDYPLNWINEKIAPTNERKARKFEQKERGQIPTKREPEDFRQSIETPTWFKAVQLGILGSVVGLMYYRKDSGAIEEPEEPEEQKEE